MKWKKRSKVLIMGSFAYRENVADTRESLVGGLLGGSGDRFLEGMASRWGCFRDVLENFREWS